MNVWLSIVLGGVFTFAIRLSFIGLLAHRTLPRWLGEALRLVPSAALSALIAADLAAPAPPPLMNAKLLAAALAAVVAWRTRGVAWSVLAGMAVFLALNAWGR
jgi:branched-subunit amino acid transport protein